MECCSTGRFYGKEWYDLYFDRLCLVSNHCVTIRLFSFLREAREDVFLMIQENHFQPRQFSSKFTLVKALRREVRHFVGKLVVTDLDAKVRYKSTHS